MTPENTVIAIALLLCVVCIGVLYVIMTKGIDNDE